MVLIVTVVLLTFLSFYKGKAILFSIIVSFYPAVAMYISFPYKSSFILFDDNANQVFYSHLLIFSVFFLASFFVARRIIHSDGNRSGLVGFIDALALSISVVLLATTLTFHVLPYRDVFGLGKEIRGFLSGQIGYFVSTLIPVFVMYWMTGRRY
jgi:hypothetical protein